MIAAALSVVELAGALALFGGVLVTGFTLAEKVTGVGQRWLSRGVESGTRPLREDVNDLKVEVRELRSELAEHKRYTRHHLGPNGDSKKLHERVESIEGSIEEIRSEQVQVRHDLEEGPR